MIDEFRSKLTASYGEREVTQFIFLLFEEYLHWTRIQTMNSYETILTEAQTHLFQNSLLELENAKPIQYIIGKTWFNGNEISLNEKVLIPRPETEELCILIKKDHIHRQFQEFSILDIGTGSGNIAIDLKLQFRYASITAIDVSIESIAVAGFNAEKHGCDIHFRQMDILDPFGDSENEKFDLIVSNPPYVLESERKFMKRNVTDYEPEPALFVPDEDPLLFYKAISAYAFRNLERPGNLYFEINENFGEAIRSMLLLTGFERVEICKDLHGKDRFVKAELRRFLHDTSYWYADK